MATPLLYIVVRLWIRKGLETEFEAYERKAAHIMARYGGVIERAIRTSKTLEEGSEEPFEIHVIRFPSRDLYDAYLNDADRRSLSSERSRIIANSDSLVGTPGPAYGS
jgi:antibiotic biosynthesis monooxygenase (ABM) superfamily enzyme